MDEIQQAYSQFVKGEIAENANPYPTGVQGFRAGVEWAQKQIIDYLIEQGTLRSGMLSNGTDLMVLYTEQGAKDIHLAALIKGENK